jgi:integrase
VQHVFLKRGIYWYQRRIPRDVVSFFPCASGLIRKSLSTRDKSEAAYRASALAAQDESLWASLRSGQQETTPQVTDAARALLRAFGLKEGEAGTTGKSIGDGVAREEASDALDGYLQLMNPDYKEARERSRYETLSREQQNDELTLVQQETMRLLHEPPVPSKPRLSDVLTNYLATHDKGQNAKFQADVKRAIGLVVSTAGDLDVTLYTRANAEVVVHNMTSKGSKTATVRRSLTSIVAVFNFAIEQMHLDLRNPFQKFKIAREGKDVKSREPFTPSELKLVASDCRNRNDDLRFIAAMLLDTGARLGEIVGLRVSDVFLKDEIPHVFIQPHEALGRTLKTPASKRRVPLLGEALWAADRAVACKDNSGWLFPRYAKTNDIRANGASAALNKWLRVALGLTKTVHSLRHSMRDRLRDASVPRDIQDAIGGWGTRTVGEGYGEGYSLQIFLEHLRHTSLNPREKP